MTVADICTRHVITAHPEETVVEAAGRMRRQHVGDVVVTDGQKRPVGILTDRDIVVSAVAQTPERLPSLRVHDIMSAELVTARETDPIERAVGAMRAHGIRRLPVVDVDGELVGILTMDDLVRRLSTDIGQLVGLIDLERRQERQSRVSV
jgi:CBS domain-containing protein